MFLLTLFGGIFSKYKLDIIIFGLVAALALTIFVCLHHIQTLATEKALIAQQLVAVEASKTAIQREQKESNARADALLNELNQIRSGSEAKKNSLMKHDFDKLGAAKPSLMEDKINAAIAAQKKRLEGLSRE
jgi:hypothetical protein